jgi:hypothetical protein
MNRKEFTDLIESAKKVTFNSADPMSPLRNKIQEVIDAIEEIGGRPQKFGGDLKVLLAKVNSSNAKGKASFEEKRKKLIEILSTITFGVE